MSERKLTSDPLPNRKYDHAFAIVRIDHYDIPDSATDHVTLTKVVWRQDVAEAEVARLNSLNSDKGCEYVWQLTRVEKEKNTTTQKVDWRVKRVYYLPGEGE
jgi:hypothetical protein